MSKTDMHPFTKISYWKESGRQSSMTHALHTLDVRCFLTSRPEAPPVRSGYHHILWTRQFVVFSPMICFCFRVSSELHKGTVCVQHDVTSASRSGPVSISWLSTERRDLQPGFAGKRWNAADRSVRKKRGCGPQTRCSMVDTRASQRHKVRKWENTISLCGERRTLARALSWRE